MLLETCNAIQCHLFFTDPFMFLDELNDELLVANNVTVSNCNSSPQNGQIAAPQQDILQRNQHLSQLLSSNSVPSPMSSVQAQIQPSAGPKISAIAISVNSNLAAGVNDGAIAVSLNNAAASNFANFAQPRNAMSVATVGGMIRTQLVSNAVSQSGMANVALAHPVNSGLVQALGQQATNSGIVQNYLNRTGTNMQFVGSTAQTNYSAGSVMLTHNGPLSGSSLQTQQQHVLQIQVCFVLFFFTVYYCCC
jgi:hypothetical protein